MVSGDDRRGRIWIAPRQCVANAVEYDDMRLPGCLLPGMHTVEDEVSVYLKIQRGRTPEYVVS